MSYPTHKVACLLTLFVALPQVSLGVSISGCGNFERPPFPDSLIDRTLGPSVLRLTVAGNNGTGYLIDAEQGYVLTAEHVVHPAVKDASVLIQATSPGLPEQTIRLKVVDFKDKDSIDLALLQADPPNSLAALVSLDVTLSPPATGTFFAIGYPKEPDELASNSTLAHSKPVVISAPNYDTGIIETTQAEFKGVSGSPLIDSRGAVVGTCSEMIEGTSSGGANRGKYIMLLNGLDLLIKNVKMTKRMATFDEAVRKRTLKSSAAVVQMTPALNVPNHFTNLELLSWAVAVHNSKNDYMSSRSYFSCPVVRAFAERGLDPVLYLVMDLADDAAQARAMLLVANNAQQDGRQADANKNYAIAASAMERAINSQIADHPQSMIKVACSSSLASSALAPLAEGQSWLHLPSNIKQGKPSCETAAPDPYLAYLFQDYSLIALSRANITIGPERDALFKKSAALASFAILTQEEDQQAVAYTLLGDALREQSDHAGASQAYATAFRKGLRTDWVKGNWKYSAERSGRSVATIAGSKTIDTSQLLQSLSYIDPK